uniref:PDZ domain-containing protein n=1 Tax=Panagrellus redivivus TaxID=6233 RepID=A0A7E4W070_PANRE
MRRIDGSAVGEGSAKVQSGDERCIGKLYSDKEQKKKPEEERPKTIDGLPTAVPAMTGKFAPDPRSLGPLQHPTEKLEIDLDLDDELMVKINSKMVVEGYKRMGVCEAKLHIGDKIMMLNGKNIASAKELEGVITKLGGHVRLTVLRAMFTTNAHPFRLNKHGYTASLIASEYPHDQFLIAHISYRPAVHLGISVNSHEGIVVISRVEPGSLAARKFEVSDIVIDIDGEPVHDKNEFRNFLMEAMDRNSYASVLFQRPYSQKSILASKIALGAPLQEARDPPLPHDAMMIGRRAAQRFKAHEDNSREIKSVLHESPMNCKCGLQFHDSASEFEIQSDIPEWKKLAPVPTRQQMSARLRNRRLRKKGTNPSSTSIALDSADTVAPPMLSANVSPTGGPADPNGGGEDDSSKRQKKSIVQRMTNSLREKKNKFMGKKPAAPTAANNNTPDASMSDKKKAQKDTDSATESSSRKQKKKKHHAPAAGAAPPKQADDVSHSDRRKPSEKDNSERRKPSERSTRHADSGSQKQRRPDDYAEKKQKKR